MSPHPPFRKVFEGVATRTQMFKLFDRHRNAPDAERISGKPYAGEWFAIDQAEYQFMLDILPPLFMRTGMFGMSEYKAGYVTSVFVAIRIRGRERWFHGFCDLTDKHSPDALRAAIVAHETRSADSMTRDEKLELIWSRASPDYKGIAGASNPDAWPTEQHGKRTILVFEPGAGTVLKLLEDLTDQEIEEKLPAAFRNHGRSNGE